MEESALLLDPSQREIVEQAIRDHCDHRGWMLHAVNCRSNHCHVVVTARDYNGEQVRDQFKAWATRRLKSREKQCLPDMKTVRDHWWTRKGSVRQLFDEASIEAAVFYATEAQDIGGSKSNL